MGCNNNRNNQDDDCLKYITRHKRNPNITLKYITILQLDMNLISLP